LQYGGWHLVKLDRSKKRMFGCDSVSSINSVSPRMQGGSLGPLPALLTPYRTLCLMPSLSAVAGRSHRTFVSRQRGLSDPPAAGSSARTNTRILRRTASTGCSPTRLGSWGFRVLILSGKDDRRQKWHSVRCCGAWVQHFENQKQMPPITMCFRWMRRPFGSTRT
jgi:hypothetical protein